LDKRHDIDWRAFLDPAFLICLAALVSASAGFAITGRAKVQKEAMPLKKPLAELDEKAIAPYKVVDKGKIRYADVIKALGTEEYIQWQLEDTSVEAGSPVRFISLFVTYYTGKTLDAVVHTPEACYLGGGNLPGGAYNEEFVLSDWSKDKLAGKEVSVPVRCAVFSKGSTQAWESESPFTVMYTFKVNGTYLRDRTATRAALNWNMSRYAYYAKVEWLFFGPGSMGSSRVYPSKEEANKASRRLLSVIVGELERSHWPDWENVDRQGK
jgi:hypothetical protein